MLFYKKITSPIGELILITAPQALIGIRWEKIGADLNAARIAANEDNHPILVKTETQLKEYFEGRRRAFNLELEFRGTEFQRKVWQALLQIPFGETRSYGQLAQSLGMPRAARAVGAANAQNPLGIVAPCHRIIGSGGSLTGFAGGLPAKEYLLRLEGAL